MSSCKRNNDLYLHFPNLCTPAPHRSYASFIESLEACSRDNLEFVKDRAVKTM